VVEVWVCVECCEDESGSAIMQSTLPAHSSVDVGLGSPEIKTAFTSNAIERWVEKFDFAPPSGA
jgi:hypothetical protein